MMVPLLLSIKSNQLEHSIPMSAFYNYLSISRQGFHKISMVYEDTQSIISEISDLVSTYREKIDCRAGSRSLYYNLNIKEKYDIGVTKFERLMSSHGLTLRRLSIRIITTKSSLQSWNYSNLADGLSIDNINQLVVGDLTYIYLAGKRYFLFCLIDVYSAYIVGFHVSTRMRSIDAQEALNGWIRLRSLGHIIGCIHHTDGGSQYFSARYMGILNDAEVRISCARNCLQNGYAEQRNSLIKHHLLPNINMNANHPLQAIGRVIRKYNEQRKQKALGWLSPAEFEKQIATMNQRPVHKLFNFTNAKNGF